MLKRLQTLLGIILAATMASQAFALGTGNIGNEVISAKALGQGAVGVAAVDEDPMVVYTNPAGLSHLPGTQITFGGTWENLHGGYEDPSGNQTHLRAVDVGVPNGALTQSLMDGKLGVGLGVLSPYGLESHWAGDSPLRYVATDSRLHLVMVTPGISYNAMDHLSIGAGADYVNTFDAQLGKNINESAVNTLLSGTPTASPDATAKLEGTGASWGFHTGVNYQPNEMHSFGLVYHSKIVLDINGNVTLNNLSGASALLFGGSSYTTGANTTLILPQNIQFGYAFRPNDKWKFEANTAWYDWVPAQDLNIKYAESNATRLAVLNTGNPQPLTLRDRWSLSFGTNYKYSDAVQLRGGFYYEPAIQPDTTFDPAYADLSRYGLTAGVGYAFTKALSLDLAYNAIFFHNRTITNNVGTTTSGVPGYTINGTYSNFVNLIAANINLKY